MNILTDALPDSITVDGRVYPVHTNFKNWIRFEVTMLDDTIDQQEKLLTLFTLCFVKTLPPTLQAAIDGLLSFYACDVKTNNTAAGTAKDRQPVYSFEHDADYIYSAFLTQYKIDLQTADLHWHQFKALFKSLNEDNHIVKIMEYRSTDLSKIKDKEQKEFYRKMKKLYELPHSKTEVEKLSKIEEALLNGGDLSGIL